MTDRLKLTPPPVTSTLTSSLFAFCPISDSDCTTELLLQYFV